jgi:hypothetical protein
MKINAKLIDKWESEKEVISKRTYLFISEAKAFLEREKKINAT